jgi:GcrA cell cycle regulator
MSKNTSKIKTIANLEPCDCRWPVGDPRHADFHFCGAQNVAGRPYCAEHNAKAVETMRVRTPSTQPSFIRRAA